MKVHDCTCTDCTDILIELPTSSDSCFWQHLLTLSHFLLHSSSLWFDPISKSRLNRIPTEFISDQFLNQTSLHQILYSLQLHTYVCWYQEVLLHLKRFSWNGKLDVKWLDHLMGLRLFGKTIKSSYGFEDTSEKTLWFNLIHGERFAGD